MKMEIYKPENSSTILTVWYKKESETLLVEFKASIFPPGGRLNEDVWNLKIYQYDNVPEEIFNEFRTAPSAGSYMAKNIKGKFTYKKLLPHDNTKKIRYR